MKTAALINDFLISEFFPQDIKLGALEIFKLDLESCFNEGVQAKEQLLGDQQESGSVAVFLPLLLNKVFDLSKLSLATILNNESNQDGCSVAHRVDVKKEINSKFPLLQQKIQIAFQNWQKNTVRIMSRWQNDKNEIARAIFDSDNIGNIVALGSSKGDEHESGQQSLILELSCGRKIAYKPRCLDIEQNFYIFAQQLGFSELYQPKYLSHENYGWMEYIPQLECENTTQIADYYYQAGLILSLLYALEAEDIHHENLIARSSQPVLVDLETLFHHRDDSIKGLDKENALLNLGDHTVLKTHFIPQYLSIVARDELAAIFPVFDGKTPTKGSIPLLSQQPIAVNDYVDDFVIGFRVGYSRIVTQKSSLLGKDSPLKLFDGCSARYLCRTTQTYGRLIQASSHPKYLKSFVKQELLLEKLRIDLEDRKFLRAFIHAEKDSLSRAEIPLFTHRVNQKSVFLNGEILNKEIFVLSGLQLCQEKISKMNEVDLEGQVQLIQHSFDLANPLPSVYKPKITINLENNFSKLCEATAFSIGQFLAKQGIHHLGGKIWPLFKDDGKGRLCLDPSNSSLFNGYLGIHLFLAYLQDFLPDFCERGDLINQVKMLMEQAIKNHSSRPVCVGFEGTGGLLYALSHFAKLWPQENWVKQFAQRVLDLIAAHTGKNNKQDIVGGSAGAILSLLSYFKQSGDIKALKMANCFGDHLVSTFVHTDQVGWQTEEGKVLYGFAHGNAGIGYSLMRLTEVIDNKDFDSCALASLEYESDQYLPEIYNWPDNRFATESEQKNQAMTAWCHGAVGIGLSRLQIQKNSKKVLPDFIEKDITRALSHLRHRPIIRCENLCHGNFGNYELFLAAQEKSFQNSKGDRNAQELITQRIQLITNKGLNHDMANCSTLFSLMNGWAGIGYQLLRFAHPKKTPSILMMDF